MEAELFESLMLICFGAAWPFSIYRTWKTKKSAGKSMFFLGIILLGYIFGILFEIAGDFDTVIYLYIFNALLVLLDASLTLKYREHAAAA